MFVFAESSTLPLCFIFSEDWYLLKVSASELNGFGEVISIH